MKIYPAMDLIEGKCVRLKQGRFDEVTEYKVDPIAQAQNFAQDGAQYLHVVDLDGARDPDARQISMIQRIVRDSGLKVQVGGGIRSLEDADRLLAIDVDRIIIGSLSVKDKLATMEILERFGGDKVVLALDVQIRNGKAYVAHGAWEKISPLSLEEMVEAYMKAGLKTVLCTDIAKDGMLNGPNFELYENVLSAFPSLEWIASGGVSCLEDIKKLKEMNMPSVILGKSLYEGRVALKEAISC